MKQLPEFLKTNGYRSISFKVSKTQHLLIKASINGVKGNFILDTGASNSCIGYESIEKFKVIAQDTKTK
ncbi:MAG: aspartyl protease family protein, partial [Flavobacterium sp.]